MSGLAWHPRGEVALIVALIGLEEGFIGQEIFVIIMLMSLVTTLLTPLVYRNWFFRGEFSEPGTEI